MNRETTAVNTKRPRGVPLYSYLIYTKEFRVLDVPVIKMNKDSHLDVEIFSALGRFRLSDTRVLYQKDGEDDCECLCGMTEKLL